ncbi:MAG: hypothetical protein AB7G28_00745 [Pirellulales bacterium]
MRLAAPMIIACSLLTFGWTRHAAAAADEVPGREKLREMAQEFVRTPSAISDCGTKPLSYICSDGHYHFHRGVIQVDTSSLAMREQVELEWFWKNLPRQQRGFWRPYVREINAIINEYLKRTDKAADWEWTETEEYYTDLIDDTYKKGAKDFAAAHDVEFIDEPISIACGAAESIVIVLNSSIRGTSAIKWIDAGTVWAKVQATGVEPEYHTVTPGEGVSVYPGCLYYYKLVLNDGRESRRSLAPPIDGESGQLRLTWR